MCFDVCDRFSSAFQYLVDNKEQNAANLLMSFDWSMLNINFAKKILIETVCNKLVLNDTLKIINGIAIYAIKFRGVYSFFRHPGCSFKYMLLDEKNL